MKNLFLICSAFILFSCGEGEKQQAQATDDDYKIPGYSKIPDGAKTEEPEAPSEELESGVEYVKIETEFGDMYATLSDKTPGHKKNFLKLVDEGFYNGTTFHRIIDGFMIQGGDPNSKDDDPNNDGQGGPGYTIPNEIDAGLKHVRGALAAARQSDAVNPNKESSGSQFYIVENHEGTPQLDGGYTVFGQVVKGLDVIDKIAIQPKNPGDRPTSDIKMTVSRFVAE